MSRILKECQQIFFNGKEIKEAWFGGKLMYQKGVVPPPVEYTFNFLHEPTIGVPATGTSFSLIIQSYSTEGAVSLSTSDFHILGDNVINARISAVTSAEFANSYRATFSCNINEDYQEKEIEIQAVQPISLNSLTATIRQAAKEDTDFDFIEEFGFMSIGQEWHIGRVIRGYNSDTAHTPMCNIIIYRENATADTTFDISGKVLIFPGGMRQAIPITQQYWYWTIGDAQGGKFEATVFKDDGTKSRNISVYGFSIFGGSTGSPNAQLDPNPQSEDRLIVNIV